MKKEELNLKIDLLKKSNEFVKNKVTYPVAEYFMEKFGDIVRIDLDYPIEVGDNGLVYKSYPKFLLEKSILDDQVIEGFYGTVGMIVNYNSNKIIVYSGATAKACLNLAIFGADYVMEYTLLKSVDMVSDILLKAEDNLTGHLKHIKTIKERLENNTYTSSQFEHRKGEILSRMDLSLITYLKHAEEQFRTRDSLYYDMPNSDWKLLSAMTDLVKDKGISARITKTLKLEELFV